MMACPRGSQETETKALEGTLGRSGIGVLPAVGHSPRPLQALPDTFYLPSCLLHELLFEEGADPPEDSGIHGRRHAARLGVLLAGVVGAEQAQRALCHFGFCTVREFVECARGDHTTLFQNFEVPVPSNLAQRKDRLRLQDLHFASKVAAAVRNFLGKRLVVGRSATAGRRDVCILQLQTIVAVQRSWLIREPRLMQRCVQKISRAISCEHSTGAVCSMCRGCKPKNQHLRPRISESSNRFAPVGPFKKRPPLFLRNFFTVKHQPRALLTLYNFTIQGTKKRGFFRHCATARPSSRFTSACGIVPSKRNLQFPACMSSFPICCTRLSVARMSADPALARATPMVSSSPRGGPSGIKRIFSGPSIAATSFLIVSPSRTPGAKRQSAPA